MFLRAVALAALCLLPVWAQEAEAPRPILNGLTLRRCSFDVHATADMATVVVEEVFFNGGGGLAEADFLFPMPAGAAATGLQLMMGGKYHGGNLLTRGRARRIYDEITRRSRDPAILDCVGKDLYRCRVFPVPANDVASVRFSYRQPLAAEGALRRLVIPLDATRFNRRPAGEFSLRIELKTESGLQAILCPTHDVKIRRAGARRAFVELDAKHAFLARDLVLLYAVDDAPLGAVLSSYRGADGGFFVLSIDAAFAREQQAAAPRDVVVAVDTSNSSGRAGVDMAASAVADAVTHLRPEDRFALMSFSTEAQVVSGFQHPGQNTPAAIRALYARQPVAGRTRLAAAVRGAAELAGTGRPGAGIVLVTDGIETEGADAAAVAAHVAAAGHRVGICGLGRPLDAPRLDEIGEVGEGDTAYAVRDRGLSDSVRHLFDTTRQVPLTDVAVSIQGASDVYPPRIRLVKADETILVSGRYSRSGPVEVRIDAKVSGEPVSRKLLLSFRKRGGDPAVARLWAARRIGHLLADAREEGDPEMHRKQIVALGRRYGIVTPHTSLLVLESDDQKRFLKGMRRRPLLSTDGGSIQDRRSFTREAVSEAELAERIKRLKRCRSGAANPFEDLLGQNRLHVRRVGDRTFYRVKDGTWVESSLVDREPAHPHEVKFLSPEWYELAAADAATASALALGRAVLFVQPDGRPVRVVE